MHKGLWAFGCCPHRATLPIRRAVIRSDSTLRLCHLGRVDGFDQDEAESKRDERAVILRGLLASKCDALESFELPDRLLDTGAPLVEHLRKEGGNVFGVGSIRDCRTHSALTCSVAI